MRKAITMHFRNTSFNCLSRRTIAVLFIAVISGCAGANVQPTHDDDYVEVSNPAMTMSPNAPEKIWVPRHSVENGVVRGNELLKRGYDAVRGGAPATAPGPGITAQAGKPASLIPHFGLVVRVDGERVYFNLGKEAGIVSGQKLKVYRGGTVVEGLGLAPGESVGMVEVLGFVGTTGGYGLLRQGGPARNNDLIGAE